MPILPFLMLSFFISASADTNLMQLKNNPFSRPELKIDDVPKRQQIARPKPVVKSKPVTILLEATMVSDNGSMVIANGKLIAIGEKLEGMKLVDVQEGAAIFRIGRQLKTFKVGVSGES